MSAPPTFLGEDVSKIHGPVWAVLGNLGDSQCYLGVNEKVHAVQAAMSRRIDRDKRANRLISPAFTIGVSDGQLNGTPEMRFSSHWARARKRRRVDAPRRESRRRVLSR